jgi:hypothetical protein
MTAHVTGDGFVIDQRPEAGATLERGDTCTLKLRRVVLPAAAARGTSP